MVFENSLKKYKKERAFYNRIRHSGTWLQKRFGFPEPSEQKGTTMAKEKNAVAVKSENAVAVNDDFFSSVAGSGLENVRSNDLIIPRLTLLQALSPQVQPKKPEYIMGAQVGDICDVGTQEIFEAPLLFLPVHYVKQYLEWAPRSSGKGLVAIHDDPSIVDQASRDEKNKLTLPNGNLLAETAQFFGLNLSAGGRRCFLPLTSTQLKKAKRWLTFASAERAKRADGTSFVPPLYYRVYNLSVVDESNAEGDWAGWKIERGPKLQEFSTDWQEIFAEAKSFKESIARGEVRGDVGADEDHAGESAM